MINIFRISSGWIMGEMKDGINTHYFDYSYLRNYLDDLMKALLYVHGDWPQDEYVNVFKAECEPAIDIWKLTLEKDILSIRITEYDDENSKNCAKDTIYQFNYYDFLDSFIAQMQNIFVKYGLLGYRHSWGYEFPISLFLKLLDISKRNNLIKLEEVSADENFGSDASRTDIVTEMDMLKTIRL